jgi:hypothetical protein
MVDFFFWDSGGWAKREFPEDDASANPEPVATATAVVAEPEPVTPTAVAEPEPLEEVTPVQTPPARIEPALQQGSGLGLVDFAEQVLGLTLYPRQAEILSQYESRAVSELVLCLGRRSGKTLLACVIGLYDALVASYDGLLRPGEQRYVVMVATTLEQARIALRTMRELILNSPTLAPLLVGDTTDELALTNGVVLRAIPCSARSGRGLPISCLILDEAAHMLTTEEGNQAGGRVYASMAPSVAQFGERGRIVVLSTPYAKQGLFWDLYRQAKSGEHPDMLLFEAPTWEVNPTIPQSWLDRQREKDQDLYKIEYGAQFTEGIASYLSAAAVQACVSKGVLERPPREGASYTLALDPAYVGDAFGLVGACKVGDEHISVDVVRSWRGSRTTPVQHAAVLAEVEQLAEAYNGAQVVTDQFGAEPVRQGLNELGVHVRYSPWTADTKASAFSALKQAINTRSVSLPDHPGLLRELAALEIRQTAGGRPKIGAPQGEHDDLATALAATVWELERRGPELWYVGGPF